MPTQFDALSIALFHEATLADAVAACFKVYRQFKMYDDPALDPWLCGAPRP